MKTFETTQPDPYSSHRRVDMEPYVKKRKSKKSVYLPFGNDGLTFSDLIDIINPMHHIPLVGPIYRNITGDTISSLPKITGSALFGGPIGAILAATDTIIETATGKDSGGHFLEVLDKRQNKKNKSHPSSSVDPRMEIETTYRKPQRADDRELILQKIIIKSTPTSDTKFIPNLLDTDPVTKWAKAEIAYRASLAARNAANKNIQLEHASKKSTAEQPGRIRVTECAKNQSLPTHAAASTNAFHPMIS